MPRLVCVDSHHGVAEVAVLADHVRERVVPEVMGELPGSGSGDRIPLPPARTNRGIVHPVILAVHHVVADLHVLQDLGQRQHRRPGQERGTALGEQERGAAGELQAALHGYHSPDVVSVPLAEPGDDVTTDGVELPTDRGEILGREVRNHPQRRHRAGGRRDHWGEARAAILG